MEAIHGAQIQVYAPCGNPRVSICSIKVSLSCALAKKQRQRSIYSALLRAVPGSAAISSALYCVFSVSASVAFCGTKPKVH